MSAMTRGGDDKGDAMIESYRELVSLASEGIEEYLAVVAELQDASIVLGQIGKDTPIDAEQWAANLTAKITETMAEDGVVPHYYISALIYSLHQMGQAFLFDGLEGAVRNKFVEDNI